MLPRAFILGHSRVGYLSRSSSSLNERTSPSHSTNKIRIAPSDLTIPEMAPLLEHKELVHKLPNGKIVCHDHHLRVCGKCCVDFTFDEEFDEADEEFDEADEEYEKDQHDENPEQVFLMSGGTARFMPQWDEEVLGPENTFRIQKDSDNPPKPSPLSDLSFHACQECELTWLVGRFGPAGASSHPSHHTLFHEYSGTSRSLIVSVDGACPSNGADSARAGIGIFFQKDSKFNRSEPFAAPGRVTNQTAELAAIARALEIVRKDIMPEREKHVRRAGRTNSESAINNAKHLRLIVVTDSSYIVESMCSHLLKWTFNPATGNFKNKRGTVIQNSEGFLRVKTEVGALSAVGVQVVYYQVPRENNVAADALARSGVPPERRSI